MKSFFLSLVMVLALFTGSPYTEKPHNISIIMYDHGTEG